MGMLGRASSGITHASVKTCLLTYLLDLPDRADSTAGKYSRGRSEYDTVGDNAPTIWEMVLQGQQSCRRQEDGQLVYGPAATCGGQVAVGAPAASGASAKAEVVDMMRSQPPERSFQALDRDGDGYVEPADIHSKLGVAPGVAEQMVAQADTRDRDGRVSLDEYRDALEKALD